MRGGKRDVMDGLGGRKNGMMRWMDKKSRGRDEAKERRKAEVGMDG